ncbi:MULTISPECIES: hypothetical protein [Okeania]|uniref:hypothetical protein n=1 Tax=Okeania TaxID=1458928 RepID=UPI00137514B3|nr:MULTISPECIES: hypothetical protein [Okeania]NET20626.1 hypothetical protein [Okeania sp. SIO1H5]NET78545.1 hypothetical protein [Okeania sp. SIO1F9]NET92483.1 hypothetical protein [Okeania sp. SIO1H2]
MTEESGVRSQESGGKKEGKSKKTEEEKEKVFFVTNYPDIILNIRSSLKDCRKSLPK